MKVKYLLNENNVIIAIQYVVVHNAKSKTGYGLVADNVELPPNPTYKEFEIDNVDRIHLGYSQYISGIFYENLEAYNKHLEEVKQAEQKQEQVNTIKQEMASIISWLNANDYIINKHTLGEYTDTSEKWVNYLSERKTKLARYNELEKVVNNE